MKTKFFIYIFTYLFIISIIICNMQCTLHIHFIFERLRIQFLRVASKSEFLPCEMPLPNFVHVDKLSKHQLAITANCIWVCNERTTETCKRCMHVTWQVQFMRTYQLPCVQDVSSRRFSYSNSDKLMSSKPEI